MDPLTHAASGAVAALACSHRPRSAWVAPLAALAAASPDADVFLAHTPLDFLLLHRGITHSLFAVPFMGLILAALMLPYWRRGTEGAWSFRKTFAFAMFLVLLHIWLDCVTTYGTMIFLPFSEYRVRLSGVFIVDLLLTLPLLAAVWYGFRRRWAAVLGLIWVLAYPGFCVGLRMHHETVAQLRLEEQRQVPAQIAVLPDAFAPFFWRVLYETDTPYTPETATQPAAPAPADFTPAPAARTVWQQGLDMRGNPRTQPRAYPAADARLTRSLSEASHAAGAFFRFILMPVQESRPARTASGVAEADAAAKKDAAATTGMGQTPSGDPGDSRDLASETEYRFYDLRFSTMLSPVETVMGWRSHGDIPFQFLARQNGDHWTAVRMIFSGASRDSRWHTPVPPHRPTWGQWLLGLH